MEIKLRKLDLNSIPNMAIIYLNLKINNNYYIILIDFLLKFIFIPIMFVLATYINDFNYKKKIFHMLLLIINYHYNQFMEVNLKLHKIFAYLNEVIRLFL